MRRCRFLQCFLVWLVAIWAAVAHGQTRSATIGPMTIAVPSTWRSGGESGANAVSFIIPGSDPLQPPTSLNLSSARGNGEDQITAHRMIWKAYTNSLGKPKQQSSGQFGRFHWSEMSATPAQQDRWYRLYSTTANGSHVAILLGAYSEQDFARSRGVIEQILSAATFAEPATTARPSTTAVGAPTPVARGPIATVGTVPIIESLINVEVRTGGFASTSTASHLLFFGNGIVARESVINGPRECYALYQVARLTRLPFNYGRWTADKAKGTVTIKWQDGSPWTMTRAGGGRYALNGKVLQALRPIDGIKLDGTYVNRSSTGGGVSQIEFHPDGQFNATNLKDSMSCAAQSRPGALEGGGKYEVIRWTLFLRFANGAVTVLPLHIEPSQELQRVTKFSLNGNDFARAR